MLTRPGEYRADNDVGAGKAACAEMTLKAAYALVGMKRWASCKLADEVRVRRSGDE